LVHSIARNRALADGNKRLTLAALIAFLGLNGYRLTWTNDDAYDAIMSFRRRNSEVPDIADLVRAAMTPW
jgi:death-on-curing protein